MSGLRKRLNALAVVWTVFLSCFLCLPVLTLSSSAEQPRKGMQGGYGEKKEVATAEDAKRALKRHYSRKDVVFGEVAEKGLYFEAEILDKKGTVIDKVIVDKRTGRIRSTY